MTLADYLPRLRRRRARSSPAARPADAGTYFRYGIEVPRLPDHTEGDCYGWPPGYLDAHREADRISEARAHDARVRSRRGERELLDELYLGEQTRVRHERGRLEMGTALARARADYERALAELERASRPVVAEPQPEPELEAEQPEVEPEPEPDTAETDDADPDYSRVPADQLTKPAARVEARRLTAAGVRVPQSNRDLPALQDLIRKARAALGEETA